MSNYEKVKNFRIRLKERAVYVLGDKCQCCGYNKCRAALEFHHLNPEEKEISFCSNANRSWGVTKEELKKCILVCANCHREIHAGLIDNSTLISSYSEERAEEVSEKVRGFIQHELYYCKHCGAEVYKGNDCCPKCAAAMRRIVERPSRDALKQLIRTKSFVEIAKIFNVTDNSIRKWCKAMNLPTLKKEINNYSNEDWELI